MRDRTRIGKAILTFAAVACVAFGCLCLTTKETACVFELVSPVPAVTSFVYYLPDTLDPTDVKAGDWRLFRVRASSGQVTLTVGSESLNLTTACSNGTYYTPAVLISGQNPGLGNVYDPVNNFWIFRVGYVEPANVVVNATQGDQEASSLIRRLYRMEPDNPSIVVGGVHDAESPAQKVRIAVYGFEVGEQLRINIRNYLDTGYNIHAKLSDTGKPNSWVQETTTITVGDEYIAEFWVLSSDLREDIIVLECRPNDENPYTTPYCTTEVECVSPMIQFGTEECGDCDP